MSKEVYQGWKGDRSVPKAYLDSLAGLAEGDQVRVFCTGFNPELYPGGTIPSSVFDEYRSKRASMMESGIIEVKFLVPERYADTLRAMEGDSGSQIRVVPDQLDPLSGTVLSGESHIIVPFFDLESPWALVSNDKGFTGPYHRMFEFLWEMYTE